MHHKKPDPGIMTGETDSGRKRLSGDKKTFTAEEAPALDQETLVRLSAGHPKAVVPAGAATGHIHDRCGGRNTYLVGHSEGSPNDFWWCLDCNCAFLVPRE